MSERLPIEAFESILDAELPRRERERRRCARWAFFGMVEDEAGQGPLSRRRRKQLHRYAVELGIDSFEADLLINGAEYRASRDAAGVIARIGPGGSAVLRIASGLDVEESDSVSARRPRQSPDAPPANHSID